MPPEAPGPRRSGEADSHRISADSTPVCGPPGGEDGSRRCPMADVRVLIVDDQETFRRALASVVEETPGFTMVGSATSGEESLVAAAALRPQLVLMDVNLPGIDGLEATRRLT